MKAIDLDEAIERFLQAGQNMSKDQVIYMLNRIPTTEIVRCKDCKYWHSNTEFGICGEYFRKHFERARGGRGMRAITYFNAIVITKGVEKMPSDEEIKRILTEELSNMLDSDVIVENVRVSYIKGGEDE